MSEVGHDVRWQVAVTASVWILLSVWALIIPPYQVGDEVQHAMRTTSVPVQPWVAGGDHFVVDQHYTNPIARNPGPELGRLFFRGDRYLSAADIATLRRRAWGEQPLVSGAVRERWAGASYPTLYHLAVFALAQPLTAALHVTPYQSTYVYRLASVFLTGLLWGLAFRAMSGEMGPDAAVRVLVLLLAIPMLAFASAGVNPDAVVFPLATLAILASFRLLRTGTGVIAAAGWLLATAWTKPSGLVLGVAIGVAAIGVWLVGGTERRRSQLLLGVVAFSVFVSWLGFYAWSPPKFLGGGPAQSSTLGWMEMVVRRIPYFWKSFWGWLGWLDYTLPAIWYALLVPLVVANAAFAVGGLVRRRLELFMPLLLGAFIAMVVVGEWVYLARTGYNIQGRHFLPAAIGLSPLVRHERRSVAFALLAFLVLMQAAFIRETVIRYYGGDLATLLAALPFSAQ
jgi:hypothetical protein